MTTSLDDIPLKTSKNNDNIVDDINDPMVKDILNEFEQELEINTKQQIQPKEEYTVKYQSQQQYDDIPIKPIKKIQSKNISYYNEIYIKKTAIIIIIVGFIFSPIVFSTLIEKLPSSFTPIFQNYNFYIKLLLLFIIIYILLFYNLL